MSEEDLNQRKTKISMDTENGKEFSPNPNSEDGMEMGAMQTFQIM